MIIRSLAASAAVLVFATGGALAQAQPDGLNEDPSCLALNAMAEAERTPFVEDYLARVHAPAAAARTSNPPAAGGQAEPVENMAAAPEVGADQRFDAAAIVSACAEQPDRTFSQVISAAP